MRQMIFAVATLLGAWGCTTTGPADAGGTTTDAATTSPLNCEPAAADSLTFVERVDRGGSRPTFGGLGIPRGEWQLRGVDRYGTPGAPSSHRGRFVIRAGYWQLNRETADGGRFYAAGTVTLEAPMLALTHTCPADDGTQYDYMIADGGFLLLSLPGSNAVDVYERVAE